MSEEETDEATELPPAQEERIVDKVVNRVKQVVSEMLPAKAAETEPVEEVAEPVKEPVTVREIEQDMESQVRAAVEKIGAEKEHAEAHEKIKEAERAPVQAGKVTRFLWGGEQ
jgi:hypothetical protein